jgi:putative ABC transport system substrate-binding protein
MRRRDLVKGIVGSALSWPLSSRAQQPALPVIGFLGSASPDSYSTRLRVFREGLKEAGYVEGENVKIEYRWAGAQNDLLPMLAADLVQHQVAVIVAASGTPGALAAKAATATIPIGVTNLNVEIGPKRLELMHTVVPAAIHFGVLVDPTGADLANAFVRSVQTAAEKLGLQIHVLNASNERDFNSAFDTLAQLHADALIIGPSTFFAVRGEQLGALALRHAVPAIFQYGPFARAGGLLSYGTDETQYYHLVGLYTGRILKGEKPGNLPVQQSAKIELIINLKTAKALGIAIPLSLLGRADEVIE